MAKHDETKIIGKDILDSRVLSFIAKVSSVSLSDVVEHVKVPPAMNSSGKEDDKRMIGASLRRLKKLGQVDSKDGLWRLVK